MKSRPTLADLRGSGSIEQDADLIIFLFRETYYLEHAARSDPAEEDRRVARLHEVRHTLEAIIAKQRNGPVGTVRLFSTWRRTPFVHGEGGVMTEHGHRYCVFVPSIFEHPIIGPRKPYGRFTAWQWLVFEAAWKPRTYRAGSVVVELQRGQLAHSTRYMAKAWGWPETNVRRFLSRLKTGAGSGAMIGAETGAGVTVTTICNYDRYQLGAVNDGAASGAENGAAAAQKWRKNGAEKKK